MNINVNPNHQENGRQNTQTGVNQNRQTPEIDKDFHYYLNPPYSLESVPTAECSDAFIKGYIAALRRHRIFDEALYLQGRQLHLHILGELLFAEQKAEKVIYSHDRIIKKNSTKTRHASSAATSADASDNSNGDTGDKQRFRGMVFDSSTLDDGGHEIDPETIESIDKRLFRGFIFNCGALDDDGHELDHTTFEPISEHQPWPDVVYIRGGTIIDADEYSALSSEEQMQYIKVRRYGQILSNDIFTMPDLIVEDIKFCDPIVRRYLQEVHNPASELYPYRNVIMSAVVASSPERYSAQVVPMTAEQLANGNYIRSMEDLERVIKTEQEGESET